MSPPHLCIINNILGLKKKKQKKHGFSPPPVTPAPLHFAVGTTARSFDERWDLDGFPC